MRVEVTLNGGVQTVAIVDVASGRAIYQVPLAQTRQLFDQAVAARRRVGNYR